MLEFILGGARSGKSTYAENRTMDYQGAVYLATAQIYDEEMAHRVKLHRQRRDSSWLTLEKYKDFEKEDFSDKPAVLIDCLTMMVTALFFEHPVDDYSDEKFMELEEEIWKEISRLLDLLEDRDVFLVSNEIGLGIVPENRLSRVFRDMMGRFHQRIAQRADKVTLVVAGLAVEIK